jgi:hypothetical protein
LAKDGSRPSLEVGHDFNISAFVKTNSTRMNIGLLARKLAVLPDKHTGRPRDCFAVKINSSKENIMPIHIVFEFQTTDGIEMISKLYFTSDDNVYGATLQHWWDGQASELKLYRGEKAVFQISKVSEIKYNKCSNRSYYSCLKSKFERMVVTDCIKCQAISLPTEKSPECHTKASQNCSLTALLEIHQSGSCKEDNLCSVREYVAVTQKYLEGPQKSFSFQYEFLTTQSENRNRKSKQIKQLKTEQLIWSFTRLFGHIGGVLGFMFGMSMASIHEWFTTNSIFRFKVCNC